MKVQFALRLTPAFTLLSVCGFLFAAPAAGQQAGREVSRVASTRTVHLQLLVENIDAVEYELGRLEDNIKRTNDEISKLLDELSSLQPNTEEAEATEDSGTKELKYRPPLARRTNLRPVLIVCVEGRVITVDFDVVHKLRQTLEPTEAFQRRLLENARGDEPSRLVVPVPGGNFDLQYLYHFSNSRLGLDGLCLLPKPGPPGEDAVRLRDVQSDFQIALQNADPQSNMIQFIVYHDSFQVFRAARAVAWEQGFEVGWSAFVSGQRLTLGGGGGGGIQL